MESLTNLISKINLAIWGQSEEEEALVADQQYDARDLFLLGLNPDGTRSRPSLITNRIKNVRYRKSIVSSCARYGSNDYYVAPHLDNPWNGAPNNVKN
jgi:hypothetical protein